jgi:hypothetical protein
MFSPDAVRSSERFTRAAPSTSGRAKSKFLKGSVNEIVMFGLRQQAWSRQAGFMAHPRSVKYKRVRQKPNSYQ